MLRWLLLLKRKNGETYICLEVYHKIQTEFQEVCYEFQTLMGHEKLREKLVKIFLPFNIESRKGTKRRRKRKRKNENEDENTIENISKYCIYGLGAGSFRSLSTIIKNIRTSVNQDPQNALNYLNLIQKNGVISFFSLFNTRFQNELPGFMNIEHIECRRIDDDFNRRFQYHGPPGQGVGFVFHVKLLNGQNETKHYCLGHQCHRGCKEEYLKV